MRRRLGFTLIAAVLIAAPVGAQTKAKAENVPVIPHTSVPNFFKLPPDLYFGEGIGIATNSKGHVFVFTRSNSAGGMVSATFAVATNSTCDKSSSTSR